MTNRSLTSTIGSIFGAIGTTADAASKTVSTLATGVDIMAFHADAWRESAKVSTHYDKKTFAVISKSRAAQKIAGHRQEILSLCADETYAQLYKKAMEELSEEEPSEEAGE